MGMRLCHLDKQHLQAMGSGAAGGPDAMSITGVPDEDDVRPVGRWCAGGWVLNDGGASFHRQWRR